MESVGEALSWRVRPGRARPVMSSVLLAAWLSALAYATWLTGSPATFLVLLAFGIYLLGPVWVPVSYRLDGSGLFRKTPFGERLFAWADLGHYRVDRQKRSGWILRRGRGTARFLPPVLLLWEPGEGEGFAGRLEHALGSHLGDRPA